MYIFSVRRSCLSAARVVTNVRMTAAWQRWHTQWECHDSTDTQRHRRYGGRHATGCDRWHRTRRVEEAVQVKNLCKKLEKIAKRNRTKFA
jgi:hypothetical protein